jgi:hypothetical protein
MNTRPVAKNYKNPSYKKSDHPSFQDKKHSLLIDTQKASNQEIRTESGTLRFEDGVAVLPDDSRAKDIFDEIKATEALHPNQYALVEDKPTVNVDTIHRYTFGYSRKYAENFERAFGKFGKKSFDESDSENEEDINVTEGRNDTSERSSEQL